MTQGSAPHSGAIAIAAVIFAFGGAASSASAQAPPPFASKSVSILVGSAPGGSYDLYARTFAHHIGRMLPGHPAVIVQNMQGANSIVMATHLFNAAPKDGSVLGAPLNTLPVTQLLEPGRFKIDNARFAWIGAVSSPANVLATWHTSGVATLEDAKSKEITIGATTPGTTKEIYPLLANHLFGTRFKVVTGYVGSTEINLAMERGEVQGHGANTLIAYRFQNAEWVANRKIHFPFQMTEERDPTLKDVPTLLEFARTDEQRKVIMMMVATEAIGRSLIAPPGLPADRIALIRSAFDKTMTDPEFRAELDKAKLEFSPTPGVMLQKLVEDLVATPPEIVALYKTAASPRK